MDGIKLALTNEDQTRLFRAIGHIVVRFQDMELWVSEILAELFNLEPLNDRYAVMSAMSFRQKVDLMVTLYPRMWGNKLNVDIDLVRRALFTAEEF